MRIAAVTLWVPRALGGCDGPGATPDTWERRGVFGAESGPAPDAVKGQNGRMKCLNN